MYDLWYICYYHSKYLNICTTSDFHYFEIHIDSRLIGSPNQNNPTNEKTNDWLGLFPHRKIEFSYDCASPNKI